MIHDTKSESLNHKFIIDIKNFEIDRRISSGGFSSVYSIHDIKTGEKLAAKIITSHKDESTYKRMINREIRIMIYCQHPTIIKFLGYSRKDFNDDKNITIFMELYEKGSLDEFLKKARNGLSEDLFEDTNRQIILVGIARGMMYLHQHQIIHRDLKPANILLDKLLRPILTDFGLSKLYTNDQIISQSQQCGTSVYMAPEVFESTHYNGKADVYSFGIIMYEVITGSIPYPVFQNGKMTPIQFANKVVYEDYRPKFNIKVKKPIKKLIEKCWSKDPSDRPSFEMIFKKLAYNYDDPFDDIYDDQDSEDEEEDDAQNKYYLDDADVDQVIAYADEIDDINAQTEDLFSAKIESFIAPIKEENETMKRLINDLQTENDKLKKSLKDHKSDMKKQIDEIKAENLKLKKKIDDNETELNKKIKDIQAENEKLKEEMKSQIQDILKRLQGNKDADEEGAT